MEMEPEEPVRRSARKVPVGENRREKEPSSMTNEQRLAMANYMSKNRDLGCTKNGETRKRTAMNKKWKELTVLLNNKGPPKSEEQWRQSWQSVKFRVWNKCSRLISESESLLRIQDILPMLTTVEQIVLSVIGLRKKDCPMLSEESKESTVPQEINEEDEHIEILPDTLTDHGIACEVVMENSLCEENSQPAEPCGASNLNETDVGETQNGMQSHPNARNESYLEAVKAISEACTSMTESQNKLLELKTESHSWSLMHKRLKLDNQKNFEAEMRAMADYHRRIAVALEKRNEGVTVSPQSQTETQGETRNPNPTDDQDCGSSVFSGSHSSRSAIANWERMEVEDRLNDVIRSIGGRIANRKRKSEHTIFGEYVGSEIRKLTDPYVLAEAKNNIQKALFEALVKQIKIDQSKQSNQLLQSDQASSTLLHSSSTVSANENTYN